MSRANLEMIAIIADAAGEAPAEFIAQGALADCQKVDLDASVGVIVGPRPKAPSDRTPRSKRSATLGKAVLLRQQRLEALMKDYQVLPFAPGTDIVGDFDLFARVNLPTIEDGIRETHAMAQFQVVISWEEEAAPFHFGVTTMELEHVRADLRSAMLSGLAAVSADTIALPCPEEGIANAVLLVASDAMPAFDTALEAIDAQWTDGLHIRVLGPAPAVSFFRGGVSLIREEQIAEAARLLNMPTNSVPSKTGIADARKSAFRRLGSLSDLDPETINHAATILKICARLSTSPAQSPSTPLLSWQRDGPSFAGTGAPSLGEVA